MLAGAVLGLLGYEWRSLEFGMMGWNLDALVKEPWDGRADHPVETAENTAGACYPPPKMPGPGSDARSVLEERAAAYLASEGSPVIAAADLDTLLRDWERANAAYQIVDVRSAEEYAAGHVPHAIHIPWARLADEGVLTQMDPKRTTVVCSENGQTGQLVATVLNLLGYPAAALKWGMMDWNAAQVARAQTWTGAAGYPVEVSARAGGAP
jgi:rhodanese-related sulfurtransferase